MEKFPNANTLEVNPEKIPDAERADMETSPVTPEEMEAERKAMQEAAAESELDRQTRLTDLRERIRWITEAKSPEQRQHDEEIAIEAMAEAMHQKNPEQETVPNPEEQADQEPPGKTPEQSGGGGENERGPGHIIMREGRAEIKRKRCEKCGGSGRRFMFFACSVCHGSGSVIESKNMKWKNKIIKRRSIFAETPPEKPDAGKEN